MRTKSPCKSMYNMEKLEREAEEVKKQQQAKWHNAHSEERNAKKRLSYQGARGGSPTKRHPASSKLICNVCEKEFSTKQVLDRHVDEQHSGKDPFKCPDCPKSFVREDNMIIHLATIHGGKQFMTFSCPDCEKTFAQQGTLTRHYHDVHKEKLRFACPACPQLFSRRVNLDRHVQRGKHTFCITCEYCNQDLEFKSDTEMYRHFKTTGERWDGKDGRRKNTCVNVIKMREADPDYDKSECPYCKEMIPRRDNNHWISVDPEQPSKHTCLTMLKKRPYLICPCCGEKLSTSPSEWKKHYSNISNTDLTDCNTRLAWRQKRDMIRGWRPLLIKGILVPSKTAHMPLGHKCHKEVPLHPSLPLPCWTPRVIRSFLGNPLHFRPLEKGE